MYVSSKSRHDFGLMTESRESDCDVGWAPSDMRRSTDEVDEGFPDDGDHEHPFNNAANGTCILCRASGAMECELEAVGHRGPWSKQRKGTIPSGIGSTRHCRRISRFKSENVGSLS